MPKSEPFRKPGPKQDSTSLRDHPKPVKSAKVERADILFKFDAATFNVECKIEEEDASEASLRKYVAQANEYQNTGPGLAVLLVLDKTVGAEGAVNLFDSIWVERVQRPGESAPRLVVVVRIPGGRENPNLLRPALPMT
jgi:hypothetical protein